MFGLNVKRIERKIKKNESRKASGRRIKKTGKKDEKKEQTAGRTSRLAIVLVLISTFIAALAQVLFKMATLKSNNSLILPFFSVYFLVSVVLLVLNVFVFTTGLRFGELSTLYPFASLSFVWVALMSVYWLGEVITLLRLLSIILIMSGVVIIGLKSQSLRGPI